MALANRELPRAFLAGVAAAFLLLVVMSLLVASREYFSRDDFGFLAFVQKPVWSWADIYLPLEQRWWWAYRPLGMESFFYLCFQAFGLDAFAYFAVALFLHYLSGLVVFRLARQLGFGFHAAVATALLALSRHPTMAVIFYGSVFHYVAAGFFCLLSTHFFVDHARRGSLLPELLSCVALFLGLLCNEFAVVYPALFLLLSLHLDGWVISGSTALRALKRCAPQLLLAAFYLYFRFEMIAPVKTHSGYTARYGLDHLAGNFGAQLYYFFGDPPTLGAGVLLLAAAATLAARSASGRERMRSWLLPLSGVSAAWILLVLTPFIVLGASHPRFSKPIEVPLCLIFGGCLDLLWRSLPRHRRRAGEMALVLLLFAALPYHTLWLRSQALLGVHALQLVTAIQTEQPRLAPDSRVVILYNAPGLGSHAGGARFKRNVFGGNALLHSHFPGQGLSLVLHDLWRSPVDERCDRCIYLQLLPDLTLAPAEKAFLEFRSPYHSAEFEALWQP
ncbi:MAG: hypothetical protein JRH19_10805 [Deltaproteobacteria bacterium]|nr:hypothetical protein [Deltaproteobacteria bacterium]